jgi:hypothetical protein
LGGAVKIVAHPNGNPPEVRAGVVLVLFLGEGLTGVVGVRSPETLNLNLLFVPFVVVVVLDVIMKKGANEIQRCGVEFAVERPSADIVLVLDNYDPPATRGG